VLVSSQKIVKDRKKIVEDCRSYICGSRQRWPRRRHNALHATITMHYSAAAAALAMSISLPSQVPLEGNRVRRRSGGSGDRGKRRAGRVLGGRRVFGRWGRSERAVSRGEMTAVVPDVASPGGDPGGDRVGSVGVVGGGVGGGVGSPIEHLAGAAAGGASA